MSLLPHCNVTVKNLVQSITGRNTHHNRFKQNLKKHPLRAYGSRVPKRFVRNGGTHAASRNPFHRAEIHIFSATMAHRHRRRHLASAKNMRQNFRFNQSAPSFAAQQRKRSTSQLYRYRFEAI
ncbi:hypothetical protein DQW09_08180 [Ensifer adhaerens]|nr:hypothetical protein DQW09_08180 [Ensifer adhaerens]THA68907.1 hypothetical protein E5176_03295 [Ensifer adhaerens]